jgi:hypothetical protein
VEGATLGNIVVQGLAMGRIHSLREGREMISRSCPVREYLPQGDKDMVPPGYKLFLNLKNN